LVIDDILGLLCGIRLERTMLEIITFLQL